MLRNKLFGTKQQQPPRAHSLEQLKTLYDALQKIDWSKSKNVQLIIESLRSLSEVLIWGDQNDPTVFDYFLEKQMLSYFVQIIQKCAPDSSSTNTITASAVVTTGQETITVSTNTSNAVNGLKSPSSTDTTTAAIQSISSSSSYNNNTLFTQDAKNDVCKQVLQLLNILFENIEHQTSLYYLLSNNHINHIIESSYDFNHDEVLAHYISMLKVLSLKLNAHTIHFFFNEQTHGFALLRQALKLFSHPESMVRIASRTVCLNVLRVDEPRARQFILDYHSDFVFSRIVHELRHHLLMKLDRLVRKFYSTTTATVAAVDHAGAGAFSSPHHRARDQLINYYEEHADYLGILNEIFNLDVSSFSTTLRLYLMNKLFIPVHLTSLSEFIATRKIPDDDDSLLHPVTAIFSIGFCYSSLHDVEFLNNLSRFMLSTNVADLTISQKLSTFNSMQNVHERKRNYTLWVGFLWRSRKKHFCGCGLNSSKKLLYKIFFSRVNLNFIMRLNA